MTMTHQPGPIPPEYLQSADLPQGVPAAPAPWRTLRTPERIRVPARDRQREARGHSEAWYQALREWDTVTRSDVVLPDHPRAAKPSRMRPIVGQSGGACGSIRYSSVRTPLGLVSEACLTRVLAPHQGSELERLRAGTSLASLVDGRGGWASPRESALRYAVLALTVAAELGDPLAGAHLLTLAEIRNFS